MPTGHETNRRNTDEYPRTKYYQGDKKGGNSLRIGVSIGMVLIGWFLPQPYAKVGGDGGEANNCGQTDTLQLLA